MPLMTLLSRALRQSGRNYNDGTGHPASGQSKTDRGAGQIGAIVNQSRHATEKGAQRWD